MSVKYIKEQQKEQANKERWAINEKMKKLNVEDYMPPLPRDLIFGLIQAQGHSTIHLAFSIMIWFVKQSDDVIKCYSDDSMTTLVNVDIGLNQDIKFLQKMHFCCFFMLLGAEFLNTRKINHQIAVMFEIFSVLAYTMMILKNIECMNQLKTHEIGDKTCIDFDLGHV